MKNSLDMIGTFLANSRQPQPKGQTPTRQTHGFWSFDILKIHDAFTEQRKHRCWQAPLRSGRAQCRSDRERTDIFWRRPASDVLQRPIQVEYAGCEEAVRPSSLIGV